ncbi:uracil-DNA glycosylase [Buchnera aphidicola (Schlechtendalia chinensis)]|uniref:Uracil-DNA glycosylase n=1 Tax=Buchnera aphidicola subsp. Schlechtendalia chinensis TaxID=118110 RepID=A0A172WDC9_BUCSC|nr:uracil-DNA glycosylase [Buchnera aphidicola]ANF16976.1 uracil-DNA glycosylase [Buchnera aphidicola (Schlechtendalia chinensis)]
MSNYIIDWKHVLKQEKKKYFVNIVKTISEMRKNKIIYPPKGEVFKAFSLTKFLDIKVVIIGQDPYFKEGQAHGLAFSVRNHVKIPPSLVNIQKELINDIGINFSFKHGCLESWSRQGVFLLNSILTVESGKPGSHKKLGWENFTDAVIRIIDEYHRGIVFLLWGSHAKKKARNIFWNHVLLASHPSPLSSYKGFFGCRHFSKANNLLKKENKSEINWFL